MSLRRKKRKLSNKIILIFILLVIFIAIIRQTLALYSSEGKSEASVDVAFYLIDAQELSQTITLEEMMPNDEKYVYTFSVANNDGTNRTETSLKYTISIVTTTNLPLVYELYLKDDTENLFANYTNEADQDGTYFKTLTAQSRSFSYETNEKDEYRLEITFPKEYNSVEYQGIMEAIEVKINSEQII